MRFAYFPINYVFISFTGEPLPDDALQGNRKLLFLFSVLLIWINLEVMKGGEALREVG